MKVFEGKRNQDGTITFDCDHCKKPHTHGAGDGHRLSHCDKPDSPYKAEGYIVRSA